jgi:hypothetical protein
VPVLGASPLFISSRRSAATAILQLARAQRGSAPWITASVVVLCCRWLEQGSSWPWRESGQNNANGDGPERWHSCITAFVGATTERGARLKIAAAVAGLEGVRAEDMDYRIYNVKPARTCIEEGESEDHELRLLKSAGRRRHRVPAEYVAPFTILDVAAISTASLRRLTTTANASTFGTSLRMQSTTSGLARCERASEGSEAADGTCSHWRVREADASLA